MSIVVTTVAVVAGAVAAVVSQKVYAFVAKQVKSVETDVPAAASSVASKVETAVSDVAKKV